MIVNNNSNSKSARKQNDNDNGSASSESGSTASSTSFANEKSNLLRIDDVPVVDLSKVEFLEKLGEGNKLANTLINLNFNRSFW